MAELNNDNLIGFIASTVEKLRDDVVTMRDQMATKEDLARLEGRFSEKLDVSITSVRGDIEQVQLRLDSIEHGMSSRFEHVEGEVSRLRSAVYLLGKDRPEVLRLLGQAGAEQAAEKVIGSSWVNDFSVRSLWFSVSLW